MMAHIGTNKPEKGLGKMFKKTGDANVLGDPIEVDKKRDEDKTKKIKKDKKKDK